MGSLYHQKYTVKGSTLKRESKIWSIKYYAHGKIIRESARTTDRKEAERLLKIREGRVAEGRPVPSLTYAMKDMIVAIIVDYEMNRKRSIKDIVRRARYLYEYFGNARARDIDTTWIKQFIVHQLEKKGYAPAEVNRQTAVLKRMFSLAIEDGKLFSTPHIPHLPEHNVRTGFFEDDEFRAVLKELSEPLKPVALFAHYLGWRSREITQLTWAQVDLRERTVRLEVGTDKNRTGREAYLPEELYQVIVQQRAHTTALEHQQGRKIPWLFHRDGHPIKDFRWDWDHARQQAGFPDKLFHDFRRTAYRNMTRQGISEKVMMEIIGHKTRSMADRYNIAPPADKKAAASKMTGIGSGIGDQKSPQMDTPSQEPKS
jgi:integrase